MAPGIAAFRMMRDQTPQGGRIINNATAGGVTVVLFEATFDAVAHGALHVASPAGPLITSRALPYDTRPAPRAT